MQRLMVTCLAMALFVGCGSAAPAEDMAAVTGNTSGGPAAPVPSSTAGRPSGSAAGTGAGAIPGLMMSSVTCGTATCMGFMIAGMGAAACCADEATSACGTMQGGMCAAKPPVAELCPKIAPIFGMPVTSCCQPDNTCGVDGSTFGRGCGPYSGLSRIPGAMVPPETMCDGTPIAPAAGTAGTGAAGTSAAGSSAAGSSAAGSGAAGSGAAGGGAAGSGAAGSGTGTAGVGGSAASGGNAGTGGAAGN